MEVAAVFSTKKLTHDQRLGLQGAERASMMDVQGQRKPHTNTLVRVETLAASHECMMA